jgi:diguanylate cyclase (GGDEF)-like protein
MLDSTMIFVVMLVGYIAAVIVIMRLLRSLARVRRQAGHDELTGLMCRSTASRYLAERRQGGRATTVIMLDLDRFKAVNDTYGHRAGDQLLAAVGSRLAGQMRLLGGAAARLGGDEFLLILPAAALSEHTEQVQAILRNLEAPVAADSHRGPVALRPSATAGIATTLDNDWTVLLCAADYALHEAKLLGIRYVCYEPDLRTPSLDDGHPAHSAREQRADSRHITASGWAIGYPA